MTSHIPHHLLLPQDMVMVLDTETGNVTKWHASDFKHAASVDPERYVLAGADKSGPTHVDHSQKVEEDDE